MSTLCRPALGATRTTPFNDIPMAFLHRLVKFLTMAMDYFTKWIEVEPITTIFAKRVMCIYWKKIICRFGLLAIIVSDNDTQFAARAVVELCAQYGIKQSFTLVEHP
ncbi:hypothetical protein CR513_62382, partial [Mucuna pruriens]